jgi:hypothetical protein
MHPDILFASVNLCYFPQVDDMEILVDIMALIF